MKKKLKGHISISRIYGEEGYIEIQITDSNSRAQFLEIKIDFEEFAKCLMGQSHMDMEFTPRGLNVVGMKKEQKGLTFEIPEDYGWSDRIEYAEKNVDSHADKGWKAVKYFRSQTSFTNEGGKNYSNTSQFRYVKG